MNNDQQFQNFLKFTIASASNDFISNLLTHGFVVEHFGEGFGLHHHVAMGTRGHAWEK